MPFLDYFAIKNPLWVDRMPTNPMVQFTLDRIAEHKATPELIRRDFLSRTIAAQQAQPDRMSEDDLIAHNTGNVIAGSDTTSITLAAIFYYLLKHQSVYRRLVAEIDVLVDARVGSITDKQKPITYSESLKMPYLQAVFKESMRLHPAVGLPLERVVPPGGATFCGVTLPEHTIVGINAWVVHRDKEIFGEDADLYRPERWLESEEKTRKMERVNLTV